MAALIRQFRQTICPLTRAVVFGGARQGSTGPKHPGEVYHEFDNEPRTNVDAFYQQQSKQPLRDEDEIPQRLGNLSHDQRNEILETLRGNPDPFDALVKKQDDKNFDMGRFQSPIIVPSTSGERLIGCVCEEDATEVVWMVLYSGERKKCECGNWFQLHDVEGAVDH